MLDFDSDNTTECIIPAFTRVNNPGYTIYPWGSFDNDDNQSKKGEVYCDAAGSLDLYIPQNSIYIGHYIIFMGKGNSTNKAGDVTVSYFLQGEIPDFMLDTIFNYSQKYPYGNWMTPISWNDRPYITRQNVTDYFDIYAIEIKANISIFTSLYPEYTNITLKETPTCGNDLLIGEYSSEESQPPSEIPEFDILKIIVLLLLILFVLFAISYRKGNLFRHHEHLGKLVKGIKKGDKK